METGERVQKMIPPQFKKIGGEIETEELDTIISRSRSTVRTRVSDTMKVTATMRAEETEGQTIPRQKRVVTLVVRPENKNAIREEEGAKTEVEEEEREMSMNARQVLHITKMRVHNVIQEQEEEEEMTKRQRRLHHRNTMILRNAVQAEEEEKKVRLRILLSLVYVATDVKLLKMKNMVVAVTSAEDIAVVTIKGNLIKIYFSS